ncbi:hypothetical protein B296_00030717 [Ensete ventricosum]|uniref:Uncharacterized protein n=1 Tax=Ensete ventricosum TaxID=4639 RepID=A0A426Y5U2_ENSVE|nr:hypothetical protein B296_00030717 [Ensete ventricosum]
MPPQDQAPVKDADLEPMLMNLKEGDCYVVNHGEAWLRRRVQTWQEEKVRHRACAVERMEHKLSGWGDNDGVGKVPLHEEDNLMQKDVDGEEGPSQISCDRGEDDRLDRWTSKGYH